MRIRLQPGASLPPTVTLPFPIRLLEVNGEWVTFEMGEAQVQLSSDDGVNRTGHLVTINGVQYVFQGGGRSLELESRQRDRPVDRSRSTPTSPARGEVFFMLRGSRVDFAPRELDIEMREDSDEVEYSDRLGFLFHSSAEDGVTLVTTDPFADAVLSPFAIGDLDEVDGLVTVINHTGRYFAIQGLGEEEGFFRFRVGELMFTRKDEDQPCNRC